MSPSHQYNFKIKDAASLFSSFKTLKFPKRTSLELRSNLIATEKKKKKKFQNHEIYSEFVLLSTEKPENIFFTSFAK